MEQKQQKKNSMITITLRTPPEEYEEFEKKLKKLLEIYNMKKYSSLTRALIDSEFRRQGL